MPPLEHFAPAATTARYYGLVAAYRAVALCNHCAETSLPTRSGTIALANNYVRKQAAAAWTPRQAIIDSLRESMVRRGSQFSAS